MDKIVAIYQYKDLDGSVLHETVRYEPKDFRQRRPDGNGGYIWNLNGIEPILYRLPEITEAIRLGDVIFIVEGEKDADNLVKLGFEATTCPMGAGKWRMSYSFTLQGAKVVIIPDRDEAGRNHAQQIANQLYWLTECIKILILPGKGKDVSDWIKAGGTKEQLEDLINEAPVYMPLVVRQRYEKHLKKLSIEKLLKESGYIKHMREYPKIDLIYDQLLFCKKAMEYQIPKKGGVLIATK
jgi:DNA primase